MKKLTRKELGTELAKACGLRAPDQAWWEAAVDAVCDLTGYEPAPEEPTWWNRRLAICGVGGHAHYGHAAVIGDSIADTVIPESGLVASHNARPDVEAGLAKLIEGLEGVFSEEPDPWKALTKIRRLLDEAKP